MASLINIFWFKEIIKDVEYFWNLSKYADLLTAIITWLVFDNNNSYYK